MRLPSLSVVIPTRNRHDSLMIALDSITLQTRLPLEIVIVDQTAAALDDGRRAALDAFEQEAAPSRGGGRQAEAS